MLTTNIATELKYPLQSLCSSIKILKLLLRIVFSFSDTSKMFSWTSTSSVVLTFFRSLNFAFCNLLRSVVFPAPLHPTIMHLTCRIVNFSLLRKSVSRISSVCIFVLPVNIMHLQGSIVKYIKMLIFFF